MLFRQHTAPTYQWGIWKLTETLEELLQLLPNNGDVYLTALETFTSRSRKTEWLAVRVLLYTLLGEYHPIHYNTNKKPYFADGNAFLSISHTKGYVAVIVSKTNQVGIDIEMMSERVHKVAHKFVSPEEFLPEDPLQKTQALLLIWSAKETIFKCINEEAVDFREHLYIDLSKNDGNQFQAKETRSLHKRSFLINYILDKDFVMTWLVL